VADRIPTLHDLKVHLPTQHRRDALHNKVHHLAKTQVFLTLENLDYSVDPLTLGFLSSANPPFPHLLSHALTSLQWPS
jgi:hypothetical protein